MILKDRLVASDDHGMHRTDPGYERNMRPSREDDLKSEVGQTLALFGTGLAIVLFGLLVGMVL